MTTYSASSLRAENGSATATCTYPYRGASPLNMRASRTSPAFLPKGSDTGRLVLNNGRPAGEGRGVHYTSARSPVMTGTYSTSFGAAGEALSASHAMMAGAKRSMEEEHAMDTEVKQKMSPHMRMSHTMPSQSAGAMENAARQYGFSYTPHQHTRTGSGDTPPPPLVLPSAASPTSSSVTEDADIKDMSGSHHGQTIHKCESCSKVYRHPSCLIKHRWEHTMYWKEASKFLMSKHQQVQLLEAAAILVGMDSNARSLPEEKALWPAAVSPPSSGLLGCEHVNFDTLMATKARNAAMFNDPARMQYGTSAPAGGELNVRGHRAESMQTSPMMRPDEYRRHRHEELAEDGDDSGDMDSHVPEDSYGLNSGGDVMADMDMDADE
ncbi:hypothetical protein ACI68E_004457 [Malassezia pachydermatis]